MIKLYFAFFLSLFLFLPFCSYTQDCPQNPNIIIGSQADLDQFVMDYPNCNKISGEVEIYNTDVSNLLALSHIDTILGDLVIRKNPNLKTLEGLENLKHIGGKLHVISCDSLLHIQHLSNLDSIRFALYIVDNGSLIDLNGLQNINHIGRELLINDNVNLESLEGLHNLVSTGRDFNIQFNPKLTSLMGLRSLRYVYDGISIIRSEGVTSLAGLDALEQVHSLWIDATPIENLEGLGNLSTINGISFQINSCNSLESLEGLDSLTEIEADFWIAFTPYLINVDALEKIQKINGDVFFINNLLLENVDGLSNVTQMDGEIFIRNNPGLKSLHGFRNIDTSGITELTLIENPNLNFCAVQSICDFLEGDKPREIYDNAMDCNSETEITTLCATVYNEEIDFSDLRVYPNPSSNWIKIVGLDRTSVSSFCIYNSMGIKLMEGQGHHDLIDIASLTSGIYTLEFMIDGHRVISNFVKQ